jgi:hypothetical protein
VAGLLGRNTKMRNKIWKKEFVMGIILLFIGANVTPNISGSISENKNDISNESNPVDITLTDWIKDVISIDQNGEIVLITNSTDIEVDNLDIVQTTYARQENNITLSLQVAGMIENRGPTDPYNITDMLDLVEYDFQLITSEQEYLISYFNKTGLLEFDNKTINLTSSDFSVINDTLSITFPLINIDETYVEIAVDSFYVKINFSSPDNGFIFLFDMAPNPPLRKAIFVGLIHNTQTTNDYITFSPILMATVWLSPFYFTLNSSGPMMISTKYVGHVGHWVIVGLFNVATLLLEGTALYSINHRIFDYVVQERCLYHIHDFSIFFPFFLLSHQKNCVNTFPL